MHGHLTGSEDRDYSAFQTDTDLTTPAEERSDDVLERVRS